MDISQLYMVRSAKGNDMLCVDSFLYYYDDRGISSYRWSCSKRKDKILPCKSRIITKLIENDETKHVVVKVFGEHSHGQCSPEEISKAFERKRIANLEGKPCTLEAKAEKRKLMRQDGFEEYSQLTKYGTTTKIKRSKVELDTKSKILNSSIKTNSNASPVDGNDKIAATTLEASNVYMLKTSHGREMVCVDGYLYRLEGRALTSTTYRWECSRRRDDGCKARIQTLRMRNGRHAVKQRRFNHSHPPYAHDKLAKLFNKQKLDFSKKPIESNQTEPEEFEEINLANSSKLLQEMLSPAVPKTDDDITQDDILDIKFIEPAIDGEHHDDYKDNLVEHIGNEQKNNSDEEESNVDPLEGNDGPIKTDLDLTQIRLVPSSQGNKMLCIENFLYHCFSRSTNRQRVYWTCIHKRDKVYNCKARITSDNNISSNIKIMKVTGQHMHPNDVDKIRENLYRDFVVKAANSPNLKPKEFLNSNIKELSDNVRDIVVNSEVAVRRKISRLRYKLKQKDINAVIQRKLKKNDHDDSDSMSSLSSSFHSDDDDFPLPMNLDEMKSINKDDSIAHTADEYFDITYVPETLPDKKSSILKKAECHKKREQKEPYEEQLADASPEQINDEFGEDLVSDMDLTKISTLRSAKGGELLCIDDFLYHVKSARDVRTYWECIKSKHKDIKCKSRVTTFMTTHGYVVKKVTNLHSHEASKAEVEKRLMRAARKSLNRKNTSPITMTAFFDCDQPKALKVEREDACEPNAATVYSKMLKNNAETRSVMKLYSVSDGPPSLAVQMTLKALKIPFELVNIDFCIGEHMTEEYAKMNPQKEIPVLDDDGFYLSESVAIMQYLCDKYAPHSLLYPKDATQRALVNHRLCFNMAFYYSSISAHAMAPIFFDYQRNEKSLMKVNNALDVFEKYLQSGGTIYAAGDNLTIADFPLVTATLCLEAIGFDLSPYPLVEKWYENFKEENPELWEIGNVGMKEIENFEKNPPDLSNLNHPFHPTRKIKR